MGSVTVAGWIALGGFWFLLVYGWVFDEVHLPSASVFIGLWLLARVGLPLIGAAGLFMTWVAILDIALVFVIFKGDVPLTGR